MKWFLILALVAANSLSHGISIREAQKILIQTNPDLAILKLEVERAKAQLRESKAAWLPTIDASATYGYTSETSKLKFSLPTPLPMGTSIERTLGDHDKMEFGLDAAYAIFTGFSRGNNELAKTEVVLAKDAQWRGLLNQLSMKLGSLYYAWQLAQLQVNYQKKILDYSQALTKQLQDFVQAGTGVRSRALASEAKSKAAEVDWLIAQNTRDSLGYELTDFLGSRDSLLFISAPLDSGDIRVQLEKELENEFDSNTVGSVRPEVEALDHSIAQNQYGQKALVGQNYPQIYGTAGYRYANPGLNLNEDAFMPYGIMGLQLRWNLFDGNRNRAQRKQINLQEQILREQKKKINGECWKAERFARVQIGRWQKQYIAAEASFRAAKTAAADLGRQFEMGMATGVEWFEANNQTARAEMLMAQAQTMQKLAFLQWQYAVGKEIRY